MRTCVACGYDATDSMGILCVWCWEHVIIEMICHQTRLVPYGEQQVPVVNATNLWSEIGEELLKRYPYAPFAASYYDTRYGKRKFSLRSRGDTDVSEIA